MITDGLRALHIRVTASREPRSTSKSLNGFVGVLHALVQLQQVGGQLTGEGGSGVLSRQGAAVAQLPVEHVYPLPPQIAAGLNASPDVTTGKVPEQQHEQ